MVLDAAVIVHDLTVSSGDMWRQCSCSRGVVLPNGAGNMGRVVRKSFLGGTP